MRKPVALFLIALLLLTACSSPTPATSPPTSPPTAAPTNPPTEPPSPPASKELIIFTWAEYINPDVIAAFEAETGITVNFSFFDRNEEMLTKLDAAGGVGYDLVLASDYIIAEAAAAGLVQELDYSLIPNAQDIEPAFLGQFYDPEDTYTIPFAAGTPLIIYDPAKVNIPVTGYASLWDPSLANSVVVFDDARLMVGFTMMMLGGSLNSTDPELIKAAEEKLYELKGNILALDYDTAHEKMISGEALAALMFTSGITRSLEERPDLEIVYPEEGMGFGIDCFFLPSGAANTANAHLFLNFILRGDMAAELSNYAGYINCVATAKDYLPQEVLENKALYIPAEILGNAEFMENIDLAATELIDDAWTRFKQR
ncbi:MAG: spermidine/putrescine ABC transporter substrate-binding protein [Symbiobacteriaceae bacterium]|nr:spermidine/putrescine ABC transporter substrate-binding protein [Symbiobacteriaceae bacterium]